MTKFVIALLLILPTLSNGQELLPTKKANKTYKSEIGIAPGYGGYSGFTGELFYKRKLAKKDYIRAAVFTNSRYTKGIKLGWRRDLLKYKRFTLSSGLDLQYTKYNYTALARDKGKNLSLFIPLNLGIKLSNRWGLNFEYNIHARTIGDTNYWYSCGSSKFKNSSKISLTFRF